MYKIRFLVIVSHPVGHKRKDTNICSVASVTVMIASGFILCLLQTLNQMTRSCMDLAELQSQNMSQTTNLQGGDSTNFRGFLFI